MVVGQLAQLVRASALQAEGHPFEPDTAHQLRMNPVLQITIYQSGQDSIEL
jgi:hypothetical protein